MNKTETKSPRGLFMNVAPVIDLTYLAFLSPEDVSGATGAPWNPG